MIIKIIPRDDESGILDGEFRDGDITQVYDDAEESSLGSIEKKANLFVKVPDPPNYDAFKEEIVREEYAPAASSGESNVVKHKRKYRINWRTKFDASEIALIENQSGLTQLPDGATSQGGTSTDGVVDGLFVVQDIIRK